MQLTGEIVQDNSQRALTYRPLSSLEPFFCLLKLSLAQLIFEDLCFSGLGRISPS